MTTTTFEQRILEADEGKWLYNGEVFSDKVYLGREASAEEWREVTQEEKAELEKECI